MVKWAFGSHVLKSKTNFESWLWHLSPEWRHNWLWKAVVSNKQRWSESSISISKYTGFGCWYKKYKKWGILYQPIKNLLLWKRKFPLHKCFFTVLLSWNLMLLIRSFFAFLENFRYVKASHNCLWHSANKSLISAAIPKFLSSAHEYLWESNHPSGNSWFVKKFSSKFEWNQSFISRDKIHS